MAALDVGNGPVEGHAISSNSKARFGQKWKQEGNAYPLQADVRSHATASMCGIQRSEMISEMPIMRIGQSGCLFY
jgi:hypothetical protein